jgi:hypothetical protein
METLRDTSDEISSTENIDGDSVSNNTETFSLDIKEKVEEDILLPSFEEFPEEYKEKSRERIEKLEVLISEIPVIEGRIEEFSSLVNSLEENYKLLQEVKNPERQILDQETHELINRAHSEALRLEEANEIVEEGGDATALIGPLDDEFYEVCIKPRNPLERLKKVRFKKELGEEEYNRRKEVFKSKEKEIIRNRIESLNSELEGSLYGSYPKSSQKPSYLEDDYEEKYLTFKKIIVDEFEKSSQNFLQQEKVSDIYSIFRKISPTVEFEELRYKDPSRLLDILKKKLQKEREFLVNRTAGSIENIFENREPLPGLKGWLETELCDVSREEYRLLTSIQDYLGNYIGKNNLKEGHRVRKTKELLLKVKQLEKVNNELFPKQDNLLWHGIDKQEVSLVLNAGRLMSRKSQIEKTGEMLFTTGAMRLKKNKDGTYSVYEPNTNAILTSRIDENNFESIAKVAEFMETYRSYGNKKSFFDEYNQLYFSIDNPWYGLGSTSIGDTCFFCFDAYSLRKDKPVGKADDEYLFDENYEGIVESPGMEVDLLEENYLLLISSEGYEETMEYLEEIFPQTRLAEKQTYQEWLEKHVLVVKDLQNASEEIKKEFWKRFSKGERSKGYFIPTGFSTPEWSNKELIKYKTVDEQ